MGVMVDPLSAVTNMIGSGLEYSANLQTNANNYAMNQENNALKQQMFYEANEFNRAEREAAQAFNQGERLASQEFNRQERLEAQQFAVDKWNMENEYNSPAAQAQRLRAAGINPANAGLTGNQAGSVQSVAPAQSSPASVSPASSAAVPNFTVPEMRRVFDASMLTRIVEAGLNAREKQADIKGKETDNETRGAENQARLDKLIEEKRKLKADTKYRSKEWFKLDNEITALELTNARQQFDNSRMQILAQQGDAAFESSQKHLAALTASIQADTEAKNLALEIQRIYGHAMAETQLRSLQQSIKESSARIANLAANTDLTDEQVKHEIEKTAETVQRKLNLKHEDNRAEAIKGLVKRSMENAIILDTPDVQRAKDKIKARGHRLYRTIDDVIGNDIRPNIPFINKAKQ